MMVVSVDPARAGAGELAEEERAQVAALSTRFSREDLMRAFDLLAKAELDIRNASQPRYHFEMALLRWMHLRKLVPLSELMEQMGGSGGARLQSPAPNAPGARARGTAARTIAPRTVAPSQPRALDRRTSAPSRPRTLAPSHRPVPLPLASLRTDRRRAVEGCVPRRGSSGKSFFYNTVVAQAQRIEVAADVDHIHVSADHRALREQFDETRAWLEATASAWPAAGSRSTAVQAAASTAAAAAPAAAQDAAAPPAPAKPAGAAISKAEALSSSAVQAMLEVFPAEIRDVEEM